MTEAIKELTLQEIFDRTAVHLLTQGKAAINPLSSGVSCRYRNPEGLKCAAGYWIPDELYSPEMEGYTIREYSTNYEEKLAPEEILIKKALAQVGISTKFQLQLLRQLQVIHDSRALEKDTRGIWSIKLEDLARQHDLNYDVVTNFKLQ